MIAISSSCPRTASHQGHDRKAAALLCRIMDISPAGIASGIAYATSAFIFIPAGRDIVNHEKPLLPGEKETRELMTMTSPKARTLMWGIWGLNHCALSFLKCWAVYKKDDFLLKFTSATALATLG